MMFHLAERQMKLVIHRAFGELDVTPPNGGVSRRDDSLG